MEAVHDITERLMDTHPARPENVNTMHGPMLYCDLREQLEQARADTSSSDRFRIRPYWSGEKLSRRVERHHMELDARDAYLGSLLKTLDKAMSEHYVRMVSSGDYALFRSGDEPRAGRVYISSDIFLYRSSRMIHQISMSDQVVCRLRKRKDITEGLPAVAHDDWKWAVGFAHFDDQDLIMTADPAGTSILAAFTEDYHAQGLVPQVRQKMFRKGAYR